MSKTNITLTDEMNKALTALNAGENVFITGKAGTGKSEFLKHFRRNYKGNMVVLAPTGVAALNVGGQTLHSFLGIKPGLIDISTFKANRRKKIYGKLDLIVVDEISMVRADLFDAMEKVLRQNGPHRGAPFGGVQLCVIGDLFQLPPVVTRDEEPFFNGFYNAPHFFAAHTFMDANFQVIKFDTVFRQQDDTFITILNKVRVGRASEEDMSTLNSRCLPEDNLSGDTTVLLSTTNALAERVNHKELAALPGPGYIYKGSKSKGFEMNSSRLPAPEELELRIGAQVMFTRNDLEKRWVNGTLGHVVDLGPATIKISVEQDDGTTEIHKVTREEWASMRYNVDPESGDVKEEETGTYTQYPLTLAWAVTIHKAQGKTLPSAIIDLGYGTFAPGQLYVALSRCRSLDTLIFKRPVRMRDMQIDPRVEAFLRDYRAQQRLL